MFIIKDPNILSDICDEENENWIKRNPSKGNHIRVNRGVYNHHGVYISNDEVIHFTGTEDDSVLDWSANEVIKTDIKYFLRGGELEVKEYTQDELEDLYPVEHIVEYARACLGDRGYNLVFNNCEHFANTCTLGRFRSKQVEDVFDFIIGRKKKMGIGRKIKDFFGGLFGGKSGGGSSSREVSNTNYNYEPDKVKVAEIESQTKIRLADMEIERIKLSTAVQIEMMEQEYRFKVGLEEAKALGFHNMANTIIGMQEKLNEIAQKRLEIIEKGSIQVVREIEEFYIELKGKIEDENHKYSEEKLPNLINILEKYDEGSTAYKLYQKRIESDMESQVKSYNSQIEGISNRQAMIIESFLVSKDKILEHTGELTEKLIGTAFKEEVKSLGESQVVRLGKVNSDKNLLNSGQQ